MSTNMDVWSEDQGIRQDPMDEEYEMMYDGPKSICNQCDEPCWFDLNSEPYEGICDSCIDDNFRTEIDQLVRGNNERNDTWTIRHNDVSEKWYKTRDYFVWCSKCQKPTTWEEQDVPLEELQEDDMWWDIEYERREVCSCCSFIEFYGSEP